uniref:Carbonic anhydrase n=1 Tax=Melopsittacus undulatus TaxID=13146 RepID=A0A8V5HG94_MELUD
MPLGAGLPPDPHGLFPGQGLSPSPPPSKPPSWLFPHVVSFLLFLPIPDRNRWSEDYQDCRGTMQSPININMANTIFSPHLRAIQLSGYSLPANEMLKLKNNGHTVVLELPQSMAITGGYAQQYRAVQLHLHWGATTGPGSEHTINGHRFSAEIHVVHYNTKYDSFKEAMVQPDGLAVLGAFLEMGPRDNPYYQELLDHMQQIQREGEEVLVPGFNIASLLPVNLKYYYRYNGSLTTPPCYQSVRWTVFNQTMMISRDQMLMLITSLRNDDGKPLQSNYRQTQSLHGRTVLASFQPTFFAPKQLPAGKECVECAQGAGMQRQGKEQELRHPVSLTSICIG